MRQTVLASLLIAACAPGASTASQVAAASTAPVRTEILRTVRTIAGQPLRLPQGEVEVAVAVTVLPPGGRIPVHQHPWTRLAYVERGPVQLINHDTGETKELKTGAAFVDPIDQWHEGFAPSGARLVAIDLVPPGSANMKTR